MKRSIWLLSAALLTVAAIEFGILGAVSAGATFLPSWLAASKAAPPCQSRGNTCTPTPASPAVSPPPCQPHRNTCTPTPAPTPVSPPPCLPDPQSAADRACAQQPASIQLTPDPLTIRCDGSERSTLTVRVTDAKGQPVPDGTPVYFAAYNGTTTPQSAQTRRGVATTSVVFYREPFNRAPTSLSMRGRSKPASASAASRRSPARRPARFRHRPSAHRARRRLSPRRARYRRQP